MDGRSCCSLFVSILTLGVLSGCVPGDDEIFDSNDSTNGTGFDEASAEGDLDLPTDGVEKSVPVVPAFPPNGYLSMWLDTPLRWANTREGFVYRVEVARDSGFNSVVFSTIVEGPTDEVIAEGLTRNTRYFWRVTEYGMGRMGTTYTSDVWSFGTIRQRLGIDESIETIDGWRLSLRDVGESDGEGYVQMSLHRERGGGVIEHHCLSRHPLSFFSSEGTIPYYSGVMRGIYVSLQDLDATAGTADFLVHDSCEMLVEECRGSTQASEQGVNCDMRCPYETLPGEAEYVYMPTPTTAIVGHGPRQYRRLVEYMAHSFELCHSEVADYLGFLPAADEVHFKLTVREGQEGSMGARYDDITWASTPEKADEAQARIYGTLGGWGNYQATLDAGLCPGNFAQSHEMTHIFLAGTPIGIGYCMSTKWNCTVFNEGLAEYMRYRVNEGETRPGVFQAIECEESGYRYSWAPDTLRPYADFSDPEDDSTVLRRRYTGLCLWDFIESRYGHDAFLDIMADLDAARDRSGELLDCPVFPGWPRWCMGTVLEDFIVPNTGPEVLTVFEERFGLTPQHTNYQIPRIIEWFWFYGKFW